MIQDPTPSRPDLPIAYYTELAAFPLWVIKLFAWVAIVEGAISFGGVFAILRELQFSTLLDTSNWIYLDAITIAVGAILIFVAGLMLLSQRRIGATLTIIAAGTLIVGIVTNIIKMYGFSNAYAPVTATMFISHGILSAAFRLLVPVTLLIAMCFSDLRRALKR